MAILKQRGRPGPSLLAGVTAAGLLVVSCSLAGRSGEEPEQGLAFSHRLHYEDEGLDCVACHPNYDSEDDPGMPALAQCGLCHDDDTEAEKPPEERIATLFDEEGRVLGQRISALSDEILFSHPDHALDEEQCGACHAGIEENERVDRLPPVTMDTCMTCHESLGVSNECQTCHTRLGPEGAPESHEGPWIRRHGSVFHARLEGAQNRCELCHQEQDCSDCHFNELPESHTSYWRQRGHGITSRMDRSSCFVCHRTDSCDECHQEVRPRNHSGMWGSARNMHCLNCHLSGSPDGCGVCHEGTPSHALGAPQPPSHVPGMNCLQCHGVTAPLPHVQKGEDCTICHP